MLTTISFIFVVVVVVVNKVLLLEFYWSAAVTLKGQPFFFTVDVFELTSTMDIMKVKRGPSIINSIMNVSSGRLKRRYCQILV